MTSAVRPLYRFASDDGRFGVSLTGDSVRIMVTKAQASGDRETGGILIGCYNERHDTAIVTRIDGPPPDSRASRTRFSRGVKGLSDLLGRMWARPIRTFYLGEWHVHPFSDAERSPIDDDTMRKPELHDGFGCPVPVLIILGGNPKDEWALRAWAYLGQCEAIPLLEQDISR